MVRKLVQLASKSHHENLLASLNQLRLQGQLCDTTVHVDFQGEVNEFKAHQVVLAAASGYFNRILLSQDKAQDTILLSDVDSKTFSIFLDFIYVGKTLVVGSTIPDIQAIAQLLDCKDLLQVCNEAMDAAVIETPKRKTAASNVVDHYYLKSKRKIKGARGRRQVAKLVLKRTLPLQGSEKEEVRSKRAKFENTEIKDGAGEGVVNKRKSSLRIRQRSLGGTREDSNLESQVINEGVGEGMTNVEVHSIDEAEVSAEPQGDDWRDWEPEDESGETTDFRNLMFPVEEGEREGEVEGEAEGEGDGEIKVKSKSSSKAQFQCDKCQRTFHYERSYLKHISTYHGVKADITYSCETCQQTFANRSNLKIHEKHVHNNERLFTCTSCSKNFKRKKDVVRHQRQVHEHSTQRHICPECGKSLSSKTALLLHQRIHTGAKPFECTECGGRFTQNAALKMHRRIHTGEKPHECDECNARFTQKHMLIYHKRSHTGEKPFMCEACGKSFASKEYLRHHSNIHTGFKPYKCEQCGRGFAQRNSLHQHLKIHTGERPYACKDCDKQFTQINALQRHQRIHTGEKPFMCSLCNRTFTDKSTLRRHAMTHDADTPWRTYLVVLEGNLEDKKSKSPAKGKTQKAGESKGLRKSAGAASEAGSLGASAEATPDDAVTDVVVAVDAASADNAAAGSADTDTIVDPEQPVTIASEWSSPGTITLVSHAGLDGITVIHTKVPPAAHIQPIITTINTSPNAIPAGTSAVPVPFSVPSAAHPVPLSPEASSASLSVPSLPPVSEVPTVTASSVLEAAASQTILVPESGTPISTDINIVIVPDIQTVVVSEKDCGMVEVGGEPAEKPLDELEKIPEDNV